MKLTEGTRNFWSQIGFYLLYSAIIIFCSWWYGVKLASTLTLFFVLGLFWLLFEIKTKIIRSMPDSFECQPAVIADYPLLNFTWLQEQTDALESLGFIKLVDYTIGTSPAFARRLIHPEHYCYAEIAQVFQPNGDLFSKQTVIISDLDKDWRLASINREVTPINDSMSYGFWRHPKSVKIYHPHIKIDELMQAHLEFRQQMINDLGITILTELSWEYFVQREQEDVIYRKQRIKQKLLLVAMVEVLLFELNPKNRWLGDYQKMAAKYKKIA